MSDIVKITVITIATKHRGAEKGGGRYIAYSYRATEGAFLSSGKLSLSAVKGSVVLTPTIATTRIIVVVNERTFAAVTMVLFFFLLLRCFLIPVPSTNTMDKKLLLASSYYSLEDLIATFPFSAINSSLLNMLLERRSSTRSDNIVRPLEVSCSS